MKLYLGTAQTHSKHSGLILQPCTPACSPQPRQITGINSTAGRPAFSLSDIFTYIHQLHYVTDAAQSCPLASLHVTMAGAARDSARHSWQPRVSPALRTALPRFSHCTPAHKHGCIFNIPEAIFATSPFMAFLEYSLYSVVCTKCCTWKVNSPFVDSACYSCPERNAWPPC